MFHFILSFKKYEETKNLTEIKSSDGAKILSINAVKPIQVLLAEDNVINAMLATKVLSQKGFDVKHVANGALAVEEVQKNKYDVILMDIQMPEMNGIAATQAIRNLHCVEGKIPIIAMTAHSLHGEIQNCYNAGMNGYLAKPFKPEDLFNAIIDALNNDEKNEFNNINPRLLSKVS
jgi:CheY-like chemotaxis protein